MQSSRPRRAGAASGQEEARGGSTRAAAADRLVEEGLELYGMGREQEAIDRWREALLLVPGEKRALDYLEAAGAATSAGFPKAPEDSDSLAEVVTLDDYRDWRRRVIGLVRSRRYEEALEALYRARRIWPDAEEIWASIERLEEHLTRYYTKVLGGLGRVFDPAAARQPTSAEEAKVLRLVDGSRSVEEILAASSLKPLRTLQKLAALFPTSTGRLRAVRASREFPAEDVVRAPSAPSGSTQVEEGPSTAGVGEGAEEADPDELCRHATEAYLDGDLERAARLYERCLALCPDHALACLNYERLRQRRRS